MRMGIFKACLERYWKSNRLIVMWNSPLSTAKAGTFRRYFLTQATGASLT
jgi:hypothetical protein